MRFLPAEIAQQELSVPFGEGRAEKDEALHDPGRVVRQVFYGGLRLQITAAAKGIGKVFGRGIVFAHRIERGVDPALRQHALRPV